MRDKTKQKQKGGKELGLSQSLCFFIYMFDFLICFFLFFVVVVVGS